MAAAQMLLVLVLVLGSSGEDAEVVCTGDACYTLHRAELGWNGAQERCRHNGGNLAPARSPDEAERLQELLEAAGWPGPAWIGLSLSRGRCVQPQEPLRGFAWAAGGDSGNYSAWLAEPAVTCLSSRCVSMRPGELAGTTGWADHPCRIPLTAFLCKFSFQGMCGPLPMAGPGRVTYTTPFGVRSAQLVMAPFGTLAQAECEGGEDLAFTICKRPLEGGGFAWHPPGPLCPTACAHHNGGCQHQCLEAPGEPPQCACHPGYTLAPDMASCLPKDACHPNPCQGTCRAHPGGFECSCKDGYVLADDGRSCLDVDECLARPCEHECHNTAGSFVCLCRHGYRPTGLGGRHCHDEDECAQPGVCPQLCLNVPGSFHCTCRPGYQRQLGSGDDCLDVDECLQDPCPWLCHNLPGSFECLCPPGLLQQEDGHGCHATPTAGEDSIETSNSTLQTTSIPQTMSMPQTTGVLQTTGAPGTMDIPQTLGIPIGVTLSPTAAGSAPGTEHSTDGPRLLLYYILGSLVAILLLLAFALALVACRRRVAKQEKRPTKNAADNYCWVPEQPENCGVGSEHR
ncbi:C1QR1 protein, partial [Alcedo cyanopectus]|nr:C1QR1 protein [Ceyx cyanopectus]